MNADSIEHAIFNVASALRVPVLLASLAALAAVIIELGRMTAELWRRRKRDVHRLARIAYRARTELDAGNRTGARAALAPAVVSRATDQALDDLLTPHDLDYDDWSAKTL